MKLNDFKSDLTTLNHTIADAAAFFAGVNETLSDGNQTARQCISHLVFWHREYVNIARDLAAGRQPGLRHGTFHSLNAQASQEFQDESLPELAGLLVEFQHHLDTLLRALPDNQAQFPLKQGGHPWQVAELVPRIEAHVRSHLVRMKRVVKKIHEFSSFACHQIDPVVF